MLLKNLETSTGLVNGARGVVIGFGPLVGSHPAFTRKRLPNVEFEVNIGGEKAKIVRTICEEEWDVTSGDT